MLRDIYTFTLIPKLVQPFPSSGETGALQEWVYLEKIVQNSRHSYKTLTD